MVAPARSKLVAVLLVCLWINIAWANRWNRREESSTIATTSFSSTPSSSPTQSGESSGTGNNTGGSTSIGQTAKHSSTTSSIVTTTSSSSSTSATYTRTAITEVPSDLNGATPTTGVSNNSKFNSTATPNELPITPETTPAFIIAAVILIVTGVGLTLIGVKNKLVQVSISAAYLSSLCITVLILYVTNLPVNNAIQGAYLVAIVMTGLILGAAASIFTEITEGLGCLLGGFCLSMWLLVLKPGGLLTSTGGIAAFICVFSIIAFLTSFSHVTRPYGLILFTSFGGATATVLGIDCVSRAGLKEFWAYIWRLNDLLFPAGATTYPLTRGLKVEIAAIIVVFLIGLVSQTKLWNIIEKRRQERESERLEDETVQERAEDVIRRQAEERAARDTHRWEAAYREKDEPRMLDPSHRDSGIADVESQKKGPMSTITSMRNSDDDIEMGNMSQSPSLGVMSSKPDDGGAVTIRVARDVEPPQIFDENGQKINNSDGDQMSLADMHLPAKAEVGTWVIGDDGGVRLQKAQSQNSMRVSKSPDITPLPFKVPEREDETNDDRSSIATFADDDQAAHKRLSKRLSTGSMRRLSAGSAMVRKLSQRSKRSSLRLSMVAGDSTEDLVIPHNIEDDRRSSLAATIDGLSDDDNRSVQLEDEKHDNLDTSKNPAARKTEESELNKVAHIEKSSPNPSQESEQPSVQQSLISSTDPKSTSYTPTTPEVKDASKATSVASKSDSKPSSINASNLPTQLSKVVMSYRTNEWAKHLSLADAPELEKLEIPADELIAETAAPVNIKDLQQTAMSPPARTLSQQDPNVRALPHINTRTSQVHRTSSTPNIPRRIVESPIEQSFPFLQQAKLSTLPPSAHTKFSNSNRETLVRKSSMQSSSNSNSNNGANDRRVSFGDEEDDNMSLSARRTLIRKSSMISAAAAPSPTKPLRSSTSQPIFAPYTSTSPSPYDPRRQSTTPQDRRLSSTPLPYTLPTAQPSPYDRRQSSAPSPQAREAQLHSFRTSIAVERMSIVPTHANIESSRKALWEQRRAEEVRRGEEEKRRADREREVEARMRRGDMLRAHEEGMRRLQGRVKH